MSAFRHPRSSVAGVTFVPKSLPVICRAFCVGVGCCFDKACENLTYLICHYHLSILHIPHVLAADAQGLGSTNLPIVYVCPMFVTYFIPSNIIASDELALILSYHPYQCKRCLNKALKNHLLVDLIAFLSEYTALWHPQRDAYFTKEEFETLRESKKGSKMLNSTKALSDT